MGLEPRRHISPQETEEGLATVIKDGFFTQAMVALTGGVILVDFAIALGASNLFIGLIAAVPFLSQLLQLVSLYIVERFRKRKKLCVYLSLADRRTCPDTAFCIGPGPLYSRRPFRQLLERLDA